MDVATSSTVRQKGVELFTVTNPAQKTTQCVPHGNEVDCVTTYTPQTQTTYTKPTASFVVLRVRPEQWAQLPPSLRPAPVR